MANVSNPQPVATAQTASPPPRRRLLRPRFSLAALFGLMTLACVVVWYWYQWPYQVEHLRYASSSVPGKPAELFRREIESVRNVWSRERKTVRHGAWALYDSKGLMLKEGHYRNGVKHGVFRSYYPNGTIESEEHFHRGIPHGPSRWWAVNRQLLSETHYEHGRPHGPYLRATRFGVKLAEGAYVDGLPDGPWVWRFFYDSFHEGYKECPADAQIGIVCGQWQRGVPVGTWEARDADDETYLTARFREGRLVAMEPEVAESRVAELLAQGKVTDPRVLPAFFRIANHTHVGMSRPLRRHFVEMPVGHAAEYLQRVYGIPIRLSSDELGIITAEQQSADEISASSDSPAKPPEDGQLSFQTERVLLITALRDVLQPRGLVCDYRYGGLWITTPDEIREQDPTAVEELVPPSGSRLEVLWDQPCSYSSPQKRLANVLRDLSDQFQIRFDSSKLPASYLDSAPVTISVNGAPFKHLLGLLLFQLDCRASLEGETIVIDLQEPLSTGSRQ